MIVNMPSSGVGNSSFSSALDSSSSATAQGQCTTEFSNFLKRKLDAAEDIIMSGSGNSSEQQINNDNGNIMTDTYQGAAVGTIGNAWKKRHIDTIEDNEPNIHNNHNCNNNTSTISSDTSNCFNHFTTNSLSDFTSGNAANTDDTHTATLNNITSSNAGSSGITANSGDMTFNLISSSSFINDLFAYDTNLVPASLVSSSSSPLCGVGSPQMTAYATPTNVCVNAAYVDDDCTNWQATDLLELDHRYNSGLQTEITQLNPTITLKPTEDSLITTESMQHQLHQQSSSSLISPTQQTNFLVPEKQVSRQQQISPLKYRQQNSASCDAECDFEDKNLSWLLNFKFDELPHLSPDVGAANNNSNNCMRGGNASTNTSPSSTSSHKSNASSSPSNTCHNSSTHHQATQNAKRSPSPRTSSSTKAGKKFEELVMEVTSEMDGNDIIVAENVVVEDSSYKAPKKPPFTYTELIEYALEDKGELTVSGIYQWISDRFPYYKSNDDRWKNSVRHNLSINPHFRKGVKAPQGAGHLWTISSGDSAENVLAWEHKKQRLDLFFKMESMNRERMQQHQLKMQQQQQHQKQCTSPHLDCQQEQCLYDEAAAAAEAITQEMLQQQHSSNAPQSNGGSVTSTNESATRLGTGGGAGSGGSHHIMHHHELPFNDLMSDEELRKTAGQILNGIHREVEVQSVNSIIGTYHDVLLDNEDYLNPIHKDIAVNESGLRNTHHHNNNNHNNNTSQYYVTEIDPMELGIHMSHQVEAVEEVLFNDEFNLNYFGYNASNDIVA